MKIYTNENNTSTLKLLIAANLAGREVEIHKATFGGTFVIYLFYKISPIYDLWVAIN